VRKWLPVGDYIINDEIAIERKTFMDFSQSIIDGRLFKQATKMKLFFPTALLIIESGNLNFSPTNIHPLSIKGAFTNLVIKWKIPILFSQGLEDTASYLWLLGSQHINSNRKRRLSLKIKKHLVLSGKQQIYILSAFSGIGQQLATRLVAHFGSIERFIAASEEELKQVRGVGYKKAVRIRKIITRKTSPYP
jgi:Fanconi anemia group M protein